MKQPTKEQVLAVAEAYPETKDALTELFPGIFEDKKYFNLRMLETDHHSDFATIFTNKSSIEAGFDDDMFFQQRTCGGYAGKGFYLSPTYRWDIIREGNTLILVPTKKLSPLDVIEKYG